MGQTQTKFNKKMKIKSKRRRKYESREEYFIKNGGILLEKQIALSQGHHNRAGQLKIISLQDIEMATNNFDPSLILADSKAFATVYKTTHVNRIKLVKAPPQLDPNPELIDLYLNEAATSVVLNNDNMIRLYGCCLETFIPILVYDYYLSGGTLFRVLHGDVPSSKRIKWVDRLRVATDTAYALSYMHNALSKPLVHRDVNSLSIVLDCSCRGKLGDFAYSVAVTPGETPRRWPVEGTPGYIDPEYIETQEVTDKCDVYSFGVLLLELLMRRQPCRMAKDGEDLVDEFVSAVRKSCLMEMIDSEILEQASRDEIQRVAQLALNCVASKGTDRPTMIDIVGELWNIQGRDKK